MTSQDYINYMVNLADYLVEHKDEDAERYRERVQTQLIDLAKRTLSLQEQRAWTR